MLQGKDLVKPYDMNQRDVGSWVADTFKNGEGEDKEERGLRFIEEGIELVQATGLTEDQVHEMVKYVYGRPVGEIPQEVGGATITLLALCNAFDVNAYDAFCAEMLRCWQNQDKIRKKQMEKKLRGKGIR